MSKFKNFRVETTRLKNWDYRNGAYYYVTIVTKNRWNYFGSVVEGKVLHNSYGEIALEELLNIVIFRKNVKLDYYEVMPNHIHFIIIIENNNIDLAFPNTFKLTSGSLGAIVGVFKSNVSRRIHESGNINFGWHPRFHDHIIRSEKALYNIRRYIKLNPLKWEMDEYYSK